MKRQLAKNMKVSFDSAGLEGVQIESAVFDGVYFHYSNDEHLGWRILQVFALRSSTPSTGDQTMISSKISVEPGN